MSNYSVYKQRITKEDDIHRECVYFYSQSGDIQLGVREQHEDMVTLYTSLICKGLTKDQAIKITIALREVQQERN